MFTLLRQRNFALLWFGGLISIMGDWVMVVASLGQGLVILPLFLVRSAEMLWIVYVVTFIQVTLAMFFGPAENALLPLLVPEDQLIQANSLNAMNNNFARLIGPPLGGGILALWGLTGVVLFDSLTFLIAGLMILGLTQSGKSAPVSPEEKPEGTSWNRFWKEW